MKNTSVDKNPMTIHVFKKLKKYIYQYYMYYVTITNTLSWFEKTEREMLIVAVCLTDMSSFVDGPMKKNG